MKKCICVFYMFGLASGFALVCAVIKSIKTHMCFIVFVFQVFGFKVVCCIKFGKRGKAISVSHVWGLLIVFTSGFACLVDCFFYKCFAVSVCET